MSMSFRVALRLKPAHMGVGRAASALRWCASACDLYEQRAPKVLGGTEVWSFARAPEGIGKRQIAQTSASSFDASQYTDPPFAGRTRSRLLENPTALAVRVFAVVRSRSRPPAAICVIGFDEYRQHHRCGLMSSLRSNSALDYRGPVIVASLANACDIGNAAGACVSTGERYDSTRESCDLLSPRRAR